MEHGTLWGHGAYLGPDYTAEYLHRLAEIARDTLARQQYGTIYDALEHVVRIRLANRTDVVDPACSPVIASYPQRWKRITRPNRYTIRTCSVLDRYQEPVLATNAIRTLAAVRCAG